MAKKSTRLCSVGIALRIFRNRSGLTLEKLGERLGVSASYISRLETGKQYPSIGTLIKFACALEVRPGELLDEISIREGFLPEDRKER